MSLTLSISLDVPSAHVVEEFCALCARVRELGNIVSGDVSTSPSPERQLASSEIDSGLRLLSEEIWGSDLQLRLECELRLGSGRPVSADLELNGRRYLNGARLAFDGPIRISINQLSFRVDGAESIDPAWARETLSVLSRGSSMEHVTAPRSIVEAGMAAVSDSEDFFFLVCGLGKYGSLTSRLRSAAMYPELHWPSPDGCFFLFHNRRAEFMRDLARIYADYHWGVDFLETAGDGWRLFELENSSRPTRSRPSRWWFKETLGALGSEERHRADDLLHRYEFLEGLDGGRIDQILETAEATIDTALGDVPDATGIELHDFGTMGAALTHLPAWNGELWRAYDFLYRALRELR